MYFGDKDPLFSARGFPLLSFLFFFYRCMRSKGTPRHETHPNAHGSMSGPAPACAKREDFLFRLGSGFTVSPPHANGGA